MNKLIAFAALPLFICFAYSIASALTVSNKVTITKSNHLISPYVHDAQLDDSFIKGLIAPRPPCTLHLNELETFVFRTSLDDNEKENVIIYLAQGQRVADNDYKKETFTTLRELGRLTVSSGTHDWMMIWMPRLSDGINPEGGNDYFIVFKRPSWWGWRKEIVYETEYMKILPGADTKVHEQQILAL